MLGVGGRYAIKKPTVQVLNADVETVELSERLAESETPETDPDLVYQPSGIVHRYSRLSDKTKIVLVVAVLLIAGGVALSLHQRANNIAKSQASADVKIQEKILSANPIMAPNPTGSTPLEINLYACGQAQTSITSIAKQVGQIKTIDDAINEFEAVSTSMTEISKYVTAPLKIPIDNLALTSHEAALSLHKNAVWQKTANTVLVAAIADFSNTCKALNSQG